MYNLQKQLCAQYIYQYLFTNSVQKLPLLHKNRRDYNIFFSNLAYTHSCTQCESFIRSDYYILYIKYRKLLIRRVNQSQSSCLRVRYTVKSGGATNRVLYICPLKRGPEIKTECSTLIYIHTNYYDFVKLIYTIFKFKFLCLHDYVKCFPPPPAGKKGKINVNCNKI